MKRFLPCLVAVGFAALLAASAPLPGRAQSDLPTLSRDAAEVADRARTKVVVLKTARSRTVGSGTGFLARKNLVITATHVVADTLSVTGWLNGVSYRTDLLANHPREDLSLLRLQAPDLQLKPAELAPTSEDLKPDEPLIILVGPSQGPRANGDPRFRVVIPATFRRRVSLTDPIGRRSTMISLHASIELGDSGSPIFRVRDGKVVGIISSRELADGEGVSHIAYGVPVEAVHAWMDGVLEKEQHSAGEFYLAELGKPNRL
jgi:S1-C subfamily serine protease